MLLFDDETIRDVLKNLVQLPIPGDPREDDLLFSSGNQRFLTRIRDVRHQAGDENPWGRDADVGPGPLVVDQFKVRGDRLTFWLTSPAMHHGPSR